MTNLVKIIVAGLGTVGSGVVQMLEKQRGIIEKKANCKIELVAVADIDASKRRKLSLKKTSHFSDAMKMLSDTHANILVELIGGSSGVALKLCKTALGKGCHVVTANKAMLAHHGLELAKIAEKSNCQISCEASVGGGIPIIKALREGLVGNQFSKITGIFNGTCNYILTRMEKTKEGFMSVLKEAQKLGYAEANPAFDIEGVDTGHKLAILSSIAFGKKIDFQGIHIEGIKKIEFADISFANELGYKIKLLGIAKKTSKNIEQRVHPTLVPKNSILSNVDGVYNVILVKGNFVGNSIFIGQGAGSHPTASAIISDIIDLARGSKLPCFGRKLKELERTSTAKIENHVGAYYVRLMVKDKPGVFAKITNILKKKKISLKSVIQHDSRGENIKEIPIIFTTYDVKEKTFMDAVNAMKKISDIIKDPVVLRVEQNI